MLTGEIRNKVDQIWNTFWSGGVSNPLSVIEQITYLLFAKRLDDIHTLREAQANTLGGKIENPIFMKKQDHHQGVIGVFGEHDSKKIIDTINQINDNAYIVQK